MQSTEALTPRQFEVLALLSKGLSNKEISELLEISPNTVRVHVAAITEALDVANRTEAAAVYHQMARNQQSPVQDEVALVERIGRPAIAVLTFNQLHIADHDSNVAEHLAEGLSQDLITRLSSWRWFPVIVVDDRQKFDLGNPDLKAVAAGSGARYIVYGSLRCDEARARLNVHLYEAPTSATIWSEQYDFELLNTLVTQDRVAKQIVSRLAPELIAIEGRAPAYPESEVFEAWRDTMLGMWHLANRTQSEIDTALQLFERAIAEDPQSGLPWYGLMWVHHHRLVEQWTDNESESMQALEKAVSQCVLKDPYGAQTQIAQGLRDLLRGDRDNAIKHLQRAAYLNPSSTQALGLLGQCYCLSGKPDECIAAVEEALHLNPFNPNTFAQISVISLAHYAAGRYDEALDTASQALAARPNAITAHMVTIATLVAQGKPQEARAFHRQLLSLRPNFDIEKYLKLIAPVADQHHIAHLKDAFAQVNELIDCD